MEIVSPDGQVHDQSPWSPRVCHVARRSEGQREGLSLCRSSDPSSPLHQTENLEWLSGLREEKHKSGKIHRYTATVGGNIQKHTENQNIFDLVWVKDSGC